MMGFPGCARKNMGGKLTVFENRTCSNIELRLWLCSSRPDKFSRTIRIGIDSTVAMDSKFFITSNASDNHHGDLESQDHDDDYRHGALIMVFANGSWAGACILPHHLMTYAKVICDRNQHGRVILRGKRANFNFCRFKFLGYFPAKYAKYVGLGMVEEEL